MPSLFDPLTLRGVTIRNRIWLPPMCQYMCGEDGCPGPWHLVHYGARAVGGAGLIIIEATAVSPEGRISPADCGLWSEGQIGSFAPIVAFMKEQGATPCIQLAHAGRKAATKPAGEGDGPLPGNDPRFWQTIAPSPLPFASGHQTPESMTENDIKITLEAFRTAAERAVEAGFQAIEIHSAHGYLLHQFLSPLTNQREDSYGGSLENRLRFPLEVARAVRSATPDTLPVLVRLSATDWKAGGWDLPQTITYVKALKTLGIDLIDVSTGGLVPDAKIPDEQDYQIPFTIAVREETGLPASAVGRITTPEQAKSIIESGKADAVCIGRAILLDPFWPLRAAHELGLAAPKPVPYKRGCFA